MSNLRAPETSVDGSGRRFGIVASRFNAEVVDRLVAGALRAFERHGVGPEGVEVVRVPGAWEIPQALGLLARRGGFDALVALGAVIRGDTPHFDFVAGECSRGAARVAAEWGRPVTFGVLTCDTLEQALARADGEAGNKGEEAALAALEMADLFSRQPRTE